MAADPPTVPLPAFPEGSRGGAEATFPEGSRSVAAVPLPEGSRSDRLEGSRGGLETVTSRPLNPRPAHAHTLLVDDYWSGSWRGPTLLHLANGRIETAEPASASTQADHRILGAVFPGIADAHVHLGLIHPEQLLGRGVAAVRDLGGDPHQVANWSAADDPAWPAIQFAGSYLTCAGGYPSDRDWAPAASVRLVDGPQHAAECVGEQLALGASVIKVMLNSDAGPTPDLDTVGAIVAAAHVAGVNVIAHAQGEGEPEKALAAGVDELAHTPWTMKLPDDLIDVMAARMRWVSTFDIHGWGEYGDDFERATANARRFLAAGGQLRYGTDIGNGPLPAGVNERELLALAGVGLDADDLAEASFAAYVVGRPMAIVGARPTDPAGFARWLTGAAPLSAVSEWSESQG